MEKKAFEMDADLNKQLKEWRGKKNIVGILNTLGDILPKCASNFSVPERYVDTRCVVLCGGGCGGGG